MKRFLPLSLNVNGTIYKRVIVVIHDNGEVSFEPFVNETPSTIFVNKNLCLIDRRLYVISDNGEKRELT